MGNGYQLDPEDVGSVLDTHVQLTDLSVAKHNFHEGETVRRTTQQEG